MEIIDTDKIKGPKSFFVSDLHFGHQNILHFHKERRDAIGVSFEELKEDPKSAVLKHDEWLIGLWNETISNKDDVYYLGDFCFGNEQNAEAILKRLNGKKHLIIGNHDKPLRNLGQYFEWTGQIREVKFTNDLYPYLNSTLCLEMCHYPMVAWNRRTHGTVMVHGHTHGAVNGINKESGELRIDVGFDATGHKILELRDLYGEIVDIVNRNHPESETLQDYIKWKMDKDGIKY